MRTLRSMAGFVSDSHNGDDEFTEGHDSCTIQQQGTTSEALDHVECRWGRAHIDDIHGS